MIFEQLDNIAFKAESGPLVVALDVTGACNFRCLHCYNNSGEKTDGELSDEEIYDVAKQISELSPQVVCMCGGEPMLRNNIYDLIERISSTVGAVNMVSNGSLLNADKLNHLKSVGLSTLQISLDGIDAFQHDTFRGYAGAFDKAVDVIKSAKQVGLNVITAFSPNKLNYRSVSEYCSFCYNLGVIEVRFMPIIPMGRGGNMEPLLLNAEEYLHLQLSLKVEEDINRPNFSVEWGDPLDHYWRMPTNARKGMCSYTMEIKANGNLSVSTYIPVVVGNVRKHTLKEYWDAGYKHIWANNDVIAYIRQINNIYDINKLKPKPYSGEYYYVNII